MKVKSKNISDLEHDPVNKQLHVTFNNGSVYTYHGVDKNKFNQILNAPSIGEHFHTHIKDKHIHQLRKKK